MKIWPTIREGVNINNLWIKRITDCTIKSKLGKIKRLLLREDARRENIQGRDHGMTQRMSYKAVTAVSITTKAKCPRL